MINQKPPRILITGKNGQVGRELTERAKELALDFVAFDSKELDVRDREMVFAAVAKHQPTAVINAAAYTAVDKAEEEKELAYAVNRDGVENLALACKTQDIPLIHISTDYVFDGEKDSPYVESDTPNPIGVYGASKYAGEKVLQTTWHKHVIIRVGWVFGRYGNNFVKTMLLLAKERDELAVVDDQIGGPTSAVDISKNILRYVVNGEDCYGVFHLESSPVVSWFGFAREIFKQLAILGGEPSPEVNAISSGQFPTPVKRPANSKLATSRKNIFGLLDWRLSLNMVLREINER